MFVCDQCTKLFQSKFHLVRHYRIHTGEKPFKCQDCGTCFADKSNLKKHSRIHAETKPFLCKTCGKDFAQSQALRSHVKKNHPGVESAYHCPLCNQGFPEYQALTAHFDVDHKGEKPYKCEMCCKTFSTSGGLQKHSASHVSGNCARAFQCSICVETFEKLSSLRVHQSSMHSDSETLKERRKSQEQKSETLTKINDISKDDVSKELKKEWFHKRLHCGECGKLFKNESHLVRHYRTHTGEKPFRCNDCGMKFSDKSNLKKHTRVHLKKMLTKSPTKGMTVCLQVLPSHLVKIHGDRNYKDIENKSLAGCQLLVQEKQILGERAISTELHPQNANISNRSKQSFVVQDNNQRFKLSQSFTCKTELPLASHSKIDGENVFEKIEEKSTLLNTNRNFIKGKLHGDMRDTTLVELEETDVHRRTFQCDKCVKSFQSKFHLVRHYRIHTGEKPFKCQDCGTCFADKSNLKKHSRIHAETKPFLCKICGKDFAQSQALRSHVKKNHPGVESAYHCPLCNQGFPEYQVLTAHFDVDHKGEKPYKCEMCCKTFSTSGGLQKHKSTHNDEESTTMFQCFVCMKGFDKESSMKMHFSRVHKDMEIEMDFEEEDVDEYNSYRCSMVDLTQKPFIKGGADVGNERW